MSESMDIPEGYKATKFGVLPEDWDVVSIDEVCKVKGGKRLPKGQSFVEDQRGYPYLRIVDFKNGSINLKNIKYISFEIFQKLKNYEITSDDVYLSIAGTIGVVGTIPKEISEAILTENAVKLVNKNQKILDKKYLVYILSSNKIQREIDKNTTKTSQPKLALSRLQKVSIPLPPLPEQHAIATTLHTVQEAKERTDAVIAATKALKAAMMKHLFTYGPVPPKEAERVVMRETEIGQVPEEWEVVKLGEVSEFLQYGTSKKCDYDVKGYPVLRIPNILNGIIDCTNLKFLDTTIDTFDKIQLKIGDILFVRTNGVRNLVGRCATYQGKPENSLFASYLIRVRLKSDRALPAFLQYYSETPAGREFLSGQASGSADGKFNINTQTIKSVILPLPDVTIQKRIVENISSIDKKLAAEQSRKEALDTLFTSLLHDLMTAKIRVKNIA